MIFDPVAPTPPPSPPTPDLGSPLGLTSQAFVDTYAGRVEAEADGEIPHRLGGKAGALECYRRLFRRGNCEQPSLRVAIPPVVRTLREESPEGEVVKFLTRVGSRALPVSGRADEAPTSINPDIEANVRLQVLANETPLDVESVLIPMVGTTGSRTYTLCVSSQVGCAMGCTFCETAQMGLVRSLRAEEIVAQWFNATHVLGFSVKNIVFMGMGEPMDNLDAVIAAIAVLIDHNGAKIPPSQITVSTVGRVDGIRRLAEQIKTPGWHRLGLALSLNSTNDADRSRIMPINRKYNLAAVQQALLDWPRFAGNKICVEYVLIPGVNDGEQNIAEIVEFLRPFSTPRQDGTGRARAMINLIPYNPRRDSPWPAPDEARVTWFIDRLAALGVFVKRRRTKGREMMGACGQLGAPHIRQRKLVPGATGG